MSNKIFAIIAGAGSSSRMCGKDKIFEVISKKTILLRSCELFENCSLIDGIVVVVREDSVRLAEKELKTIKKIRAVVAGDKNRFLSVQNGLAACPPDVDYIAVHDAARPFASQQLVERVISTAIEYGGAAPAVVVTDTVKTVDIDSYITSTLPRDVLRAVATPQVFKADIYRKASADNRDSFDDCEIFERANIPVKLIEGERNNIKITNPDDLEYARYLVCGKNEMRIGHGYDAHRLTDGRKLILGGVEIAHPRGLDGHSDADVLTHAVIDALLGAAAAGDIGKMFSDSDPQYKDISSILLLERAVKKVEELGYSVGNIDVTVIAQEPKLAFYIGDMRKKIAEASKISEDDVNVKATTEEGMGFTGTKEGIAAHSVVILMPICD